MIRYSLKSETAPLSGLEAFVEEYDDIAYEQFQMTVDEIGPVALDELRDEPGPAVHPIDWTTPKQMSAFFASDGFGQGIPTRRTGALSAAWTAKSMRDGPSFFFVISNPLAAAKFVYGSLAKRANEARRFQQRFHAKTGWQLATETVQFWISAFFEDYRERMSRVGQTELRGRAFTK